MSAPRVAIRGGPRSELVRSGFIRSVPIRSGLIVALLAAPLALGSAAEPQAPASDGEVAAASGAELKQLRYGVVVERIDGEPWVTIRTQDAPLRPLLEELGLESGVVFAGLERLTPAVRVTAELEQRPLRQAVAWILGSIGLRADRRLDTFTLRVDADQRDDLLSQAGTEYLRTLREFPNHPLADRTLFGQGLLEEDKGQPVAARAHYEGLVDAYPESTLVDDALKRSAVLFEAEGDWALASQKWAQLLRLERESPHKVEAYEQLALCTAKLGDADRAVHMLEALEGIAPSGDADEHQRRGYIRARALVGQRLYRQALELLEEADAHQRSDEELRVSHELRARAFEGLEEYGPASRSWLAYCELATGDELASGLKHAANAALRAGDELGMLFIERLAEKRGRPGAVADAAREARTRLDLVPSRLSGQADVERLARAERLANAGLFDEAELVLEQLGGSADQLAEGDRVRFVLTYGRVLGRGGAGPAVGFLKDNLDSLTRTEHRTQVYLLAAELYEREGRIDEAIEAYRGRL